RAFRLLRVFRILDVFGRIETTLTQYSRGSEHCPPYAALSYVWGDPKELMPIVVNGHTLKIGMSLYQALTHLRVVLPASTLLWVDAISINQNDIQERNDQVKQMREVYSEASEVLIWLGPSFQGSDELLRYIREHESRCFERMASGQGCVAPPYHELRNAMQTLVRLPYWERYWIIQEFVVARHARFVCGSETIRRDQLLGVLYEYVNTSSGHFLQTPLHISPRDHWKVGRIEKIAAWQESSVHLAEALERTHTSEATDPRDKVFSLLGLVTEGAGRDVVVDYAHAPCIVYCIAIEAMMED
ncbi:hypothetical protein EK21DRAFT_33687, partial [Setomelanomma holmii]